MTRPWPARGTLVSGTAWPQWAPASPRVYRAPPLPELSAETPEAVETLKAMETPKAVETPKAMETLRAVETLRPWRPQGGAGPEAMRQRADGEPKQGENLKSWRTQRDGQPKMLETPR